jgi:hypothetical protein
MRPALLLGTFNRLTNNIPSLLLLAIQAVTIRAVQFLMPGTM